MSEKLSERMHEAAVSGLGYDIGLDEFAEEVAALEAKLEAMERRCIMEVELGIEQVTALEAKPEAAEHEPKNSRTTQARASRLVWKSKRHML